MTYSEPMNGPDKAYAAYCDLRGDVVIGLFSGREDAEFHAIDSHLVRECNPTPHVKLDAWSGRTFFRQSDQSYHQIAAILA